MEWGLFVMSINVSSCGTKLLFTHRYVVACHLCQNGTRGFRVNWKLLAVNGSLS